MGPRSDKSGKVGDVKAWTTAEILRKEFEEIWGKPSAPDGRSEAALRDYQAAHDAYKEAATQKKQTALNNDYEVVLEKEQSALDACYKEALRKDQAALCLSGGGIRSAAFALGVLQALAKKGLLTKFHYLSTVSGGGYIGGFLTRWIHEEVVKQHDSQPKAADGVQAELADGARPGFPEPGPIQWLREYSNFLTPRTGFASADTWSAAVLWIRNTLINWFVFLPAFLFAVAIPNLLLASVLVIAPRVADILLLVSVLLIAAAAYSTARELPSHKMPPLADAGRVRWRVAAPSLLASVLLPLALAPYLPIYGEVPVSGGLGLIDLISSYSGTPRDGLVAGIVGAAVVAGGLMIGYVAAWLTSPGQGFFINLPTWTIGALVSGSAVGAAALLVSLADRSCGEGADPTFCNWRGILYVSLLPFGIVVSQLLLTIFYTAFRIIPEKPDPETPEGSSADGAERISHTPGTLPVNASRDIARATQTPAAASQPLISPDLDREWLARLSAVKLRAGAVAVAFTALALIGPVLFLGHSLDIKDWLLGLLGSASGATAVFGGKAAKTGDGTPAGWRKALTFNRIVLIATLLFLALLIIFLSAAENSLAMWIARSLGEGSLSNFVLSHLLIIVTAWLVLAYTSSKINVNRFSLNALYRNRLGRAFLGAPRGNNRKQDPFTQLDPADSVRMGELRYSAEAVEGPARRVLFPVVNLALNLVGTERLAWQERKAHSFIVTPLACGSPALGPLEPGETGEAPGAYVSSEQYAGREREDRFPGEGISLATAMAISGAAASPSMGYNSSPATAFLMTLFNVRLGAWLPNPGYWDFTPGEMQRSAPTNALRPFLSELSGQTNDRAPNIYLSDGGHFENLGLYEMVRRRCRYIVVTDAGCDPKCHFEDLGNAIRKVMADLDGVAITFDQLRISPRNDGVDPSIDYALGSIDYGNGEEGYLLYIKPSYFSGRASVDVRSYANLHDAFPHESTADQWFSESQFESYRRLGDMSVSRLLESYSGGGMRDFFNAATSQFEKDIQPPEASKTAAAASEAAPGDIPPNKAGGTPPSTESSSRHL
jgi:hypothetical protein